jgi:alpha-amylase
MAALDSALRYKFKAVCNTPNYNLRNPTAGGSISAAHPINAITFTENHDVMDEVARVSAFRR